MSRGLDPKKLRIKMAELGINGADLARMANITPSYVSLILRGEKNVGVQTVKNICKALNCKAEDIW